MLRLTSDTRSLLTAPSPLYQLWGKKHHLSGPLYLLSTGWLAARRLSIRRRMCWPNTRAKQRSVPSALSSEGAEREWKRSHKHQPVRKLWRCIIWGSTAILAGDKPSDATLTVVSLRSSQFSLRREMMFNGCRLGLCTLWATCLIFAASYIFVVGSVSVLFPLLAHETPILVLYLIFSTRLVCRRQKGWNTTCSFGCSIQISPCKLKNDNWMRLTDPISHKMLSNLLVGFFFPLDHNSSELQQKCFQQQDLRGLLS